VLRRTSYHSVYDDEHPSIVCECVTFRPGVYAMCTCSYLSGITRELSDTAQSLKSML